jgi:hypothetical protein
MAKHAEVNRCSQCDYVGTPTGVKIHEFRKHTRKGQILAKAAALRMNSPANRRRAIATRAARRAEKIKTTVQEPITAKPRRKAWGSNRVAAKRKGLQRAATLPFLIKCCPSCGYKGLEEVNVAMNYATGNR